VKLRSADRLLWVWLSRRWPGWQDALEFVKPRTVIAWQQRRFRDYWRRLSQCGKPGRPTISKEVRELIQDMWRCGVGTARTFTAHTMRVSPSLSPNEACGFHRTSLSIIADDYGRRTSAFSKATLGFDDIGHTS
jgi:hypothetical protein